MADNKEESYDYNKDNFENIEDTNENLNNNNNDIKPTLETNNNNNNKQNTDENNLRYQASTNNPTNLLPSKDEVSTAWELEVWKKSEQTKFKAYLKQLEVEYMNKCYDEANIKQENHEKQLSKVITEINQTLSKTKRKVNELESRENKISLAEEELKLKLNEIARQITAKNEEIFNLQKKSKDEKSALESTIKQLKTIIVNKDKELENLHHDYKSYKKEIDDSPISMLKNELNKKQLEYEELIREKDRISLDNTHLKKVTNRLKEDLIIMKKNHDNEKELMYKQKIEEIEKLKFEIYNQKQAQLEINELSNIRAKVTDMKNVTINHNNNNANNMNNMNMNNTNNNFNNTNHIKKEYKLVSYGIKKFDISNKETSELDKLNNYKISLLTSGNYKEDDKLIVDLDNKIRKIIESQG